MFYVFIHFRKLSSICIKPTFEKKISQYIHIFEHGMINWIKNTEYNFKFNNPVGKKHALLTSHMSFWAFEWETFNDIYISL